LCLFNKFVEETNLLHDRHAEKAILSDEFAIAAEAKHSNKSILSKGDMTKTIDIKGKVWQWEALDRYRPKLLSILFNTQVRKDLKARRNPGRTQRV
jgi:hypothetical protein